MEKHNFINLGIVLNERGEVLMVKRRIPEKGRNNQVLLWAFPGGKQEIDKQTSLPKESRNECVQREVLLETGYSIVSQKEINLKIHPDIPNVVIVYHLCKLLNPQAISKPQEPDEIEEIRWIKPQDIRSLITTTLDEKVAKELGVNSL